MYTFQTQITSNIQLRNVLQKKLLIGIIGGQTKNQPWWKGTISKIQNVCYGTGQCWS